jgi:DsbC/DsbD-like thiol-disulfide interchange protein
VITELGLLDRDLAEHHTRFGEPTQDNQYGVAYPAIFVLDESGRVVDKRIRENYRAREGALKLLEGALKLTLPASGLEQSVEASHVTVSAITDSELYVRWQETRLHVVFEVGTGWHVYGRPIPEGYTPVTVEVDSIPEVAVGPAEYPPTHPFKVEGLDEEFQVNEGRFEIRVPCAVKVPPRHGGVDLEISVRYQACSESECLPPQAIKLDLRLEKAPPA